MHDFEEDESKPIIHFKFSGLEIRKANEFAKKKVRQNRKANCVTGENILLQNKNKLETTGNLLLILIISIFLAVITWHDSA